MSHSYPYQGNTAAIRLLLDAKADPLIPNNEGYGAHSIAHFQGHEPQSMLIATEGLKRALQKEDFATMLLLIQDGADVNTRNDAGWSPLITVTSSGSTEAAEQLLQFPNIDVNLAENDGWTPLMFAANNNRLVPMLTFALDKASLLRAWRVIAISLIFLHCSKLQLGTVRKMG